MAKEGQHPEHTTLEASIDRCKVNGKALLDDAVFLLEFDRVSTALALAVLAQEEFAKAFILALVAEKALPWVAEVRQSLTRHNCKHLLAVVMDWLPLFDIGVDGGSYSKQKERDNRRDRLMADYKAKRITGEAFLAGIKREPISFPLDVDAALNIYCHEQVKHIRARKPLRDGGRARGLSRKVADGLHDRRKQAALYVSIGKAGAVTTHPGQIKRSDAEQEIGRAQALAESRITWGDEYVLLKEALTEVFADLKTNPLFNT